MSLAKLADLDTSVDLLPARADTDSWVTVVREVTILAQQIAGTSFVPRGLRDSVPATAAAILYGREVGLPPMTALSQIAVVDGRPALSAEAMRALVLAAGHEIAFDETSAAVCRIRGRRVKSQTWTTVEWTIDHARKAGLLRRGSAWEAYPSDMLVARATTALCRRVFPDVIHGFRSIEELDDTPADVAAPEPGRPGRPTRTTVSRRRKSSAPEPEDGTVEGEGGEGTASETDSAEPSSPTPPRLPSLPGEEVGEGDDGVPVPGSPSPPDVPQTPTVTGPPPVVDDALNNVTRRIIFGQLNRLGLGDDQPEGRTGRLALLAKLAGRESVLTSANELNQDEGVKVASILSTFRNRAALDEFMSVALAGDVAEIVEDLPGWRGDLSGVDVPLPDPDDDEGDS